MFIGSEKTMRACALGLSLVLAAAADPLLERAIEGLIVQCKESDGHSKCNSHILTALASCGPDDLSCQCGKAAEADLVCSTVCKFEPNKTPELINFQNARCGGPSLTHDNSFFLRPFIRPKSDPDQESEEESEDHDEEEHEDNDSEDHEHEEASEFEPYLEYDHDSEGYSTEFYEGDVDHIAALSIFPPGIYGRSLSSRQPKNKLHIHTLDETKSEDKIIAKIKEALKYVRLDYGPSEYDNIAAEVEHQLLDKQNKTADASADESSSLSKRDLSQDSEELYANETAYELPSNKTTSSSAVMPTSHVIPQQNMIKNFTRSNHRWNTTGVSLLKLAHGSERHDNGMHNNGTHPSGNSSSSANHNVVGWLAFASLIAIAHIL